TAPVSNSSSALVRPMRAISQNSSTDTVLKRSWAAIFVFWLCTGAAFVKNRAGSYHRALAEMAAYRYRFRRNGCKIVIAKKDDIFAGLLFDKVTIMCNWRFPSCGHRRDPALISRGPAIRARYTSADLGEQPPQAIPTSKTKAR